MTATAARPRGGSPVERLQAHPRLYNAVGALLSMGLSLLSVALVMQLWAAGDLRVPFGVDGDTLSTMAGIKSIHDYGWIWTNPSLGAPHGQELYDFGALGFDNGSWLIVKLMTFGAASPGTVLNAYYLLGFPLVALSAFLALRALGVRWATAVVVAVLFSLLPGHFARGLSHMFLGASWSVPIGCYLALSVLLGRELFARRSEGRRLLRWFSRRTLITLGLCVLLASGGIYFAAFTLMLLVVAAGARLFTADGRRTALLTTGVLIGAVLAVMAFNALPTLVYQQSHGANQAVAKRAAGESEFYGLKLTTLLLPTPRHRLDPLADLGTEYGAGTFVPSEGPATPGTLGTLGLLLIGVVLLGRFAPGRVGGLLGDPRLVAASLLTLAGFLIGTVGGVSAFISFFFSAALRAYNRISFVLAFLALLAAAVAIDRLRGRLNGRAQAAGVALLAVVLVLGVLDQSPAIRTQDYAVAHAEWGSDARFAAAVTRQLGGRGEVYQIPYQAFPESPPIREMDDYALLKAYVHSPPGIHWSYGAMKGRPEDWQGRIAGQPLIVQLPAAAAAGFDGVYIDLNAFEDPDTELNRLRLITGQTPLRSENGRLAFFDLRPLQQRIPPALDAPAEDVVLDAVSVGFSDGFYDEEVSPDPTSYWRWMAANGRILLNNPDDAPRQVRVRARLATEGPATATVALDGRTIATVRTRESGSMLDVTVPVGPGEHALTMSTTAPRRRAVNDERELHMQVSSFQITDAPLAALSGLRG